MAAEVGLAPELVGACLDHHVGPKDALISALMAHLDVDQDGFVTVSELTTRRSQHVQQAQLNPVAEAETQATFEAETR